jgi:hypothetical protein
VLGFLATLRKQGVQLRERLQAYNAEHPAPVDERRAVTVVAYVGQTLIQADESPSADAEV